MKPRTYWLMLAVGALAVAFAPFPAGPERGALEQTFRVEARQYAYSPGELHAETGDTITIELVSTDVVHGLYVDGYGVTLEADPGQTAAVTFVADKPGSFRFRCNVTCGALHPFMIGRITVGSNTTRARGILLALLGAFGVMINPRRNPEIRVGR